MDIILRNAKSQSQLIEDLVDVSRIISDKIELAMRPLELKSVVEAAVDVVRPMADAKHIRIGQDYGPESVMVYGDADRLQQVVWTLLSNAVKFTPEGGEVSVRFERVGADAVLTVSDTGQGISAEFLPQVFERFRQADSASSLRRSGLGLGLSIVRHL